MIVDVRSGPAGHQMTEAGMNAPKSKPQPVTDTLEPTFDLADDASHFDEQDVTLAQACLAHVLAIRKLAELGGLESDMTYPTRFIADMLSISNLISAVEEARKAGLVHSWRQNMREVTLHDVATAVISQHPVLRSFVVRHKATVSRIIQTAFELPTEA
jgi:hypothetical protein